MATPKKKTSDKKSSNPAAAPAPGGKGAGKADGDVSAEAAAPAEESARASSPSFKAPKKAAPVVFTLEDVREVLKNRREEAREEAEKRDAARKSRVTQVVEQEQTQQRVLGAATLADILGISSAPAPKPTVEYSESDVPSKFRKYYRLLIDLRNHVNALIAARKPGVLGATPAESSGDITKVHTHMADSATESFDRDFALSLVANEQEALTEIEDALQRIYNGSYGICEITGKPISTERLEAVPFTRYSVEGQAEYERQNRRRAQRANAYLDSVDDVGAFGADDGEE